MRSGTVIATAALVAACGSSSQGGRSGQQSSRTTGDASQPVAPDNETVCKREIGENLIGLGAFNLARTQDPALRLSDLPRRTEQRKPSLIPQNLTEALADGDLVIFGQIQSNSAGPIGIFASVNLAGSGFISSSSYIARRSQVEGPYRFLTSAQLRSGAGPLGVELVEPQYEPYLKPGQRFVAVIRQERLDSSTETMIDRVIPYAIWLDSQDGQLRGIPGAPPGLAGAFGGTIDTRAPEFVEQIRRGLGKERPAVNEFTPPPPGFVDPVLQQEPLLACQDPQTHARGARLDYGMLVP